MDIVLIKIGQNEPDTYSKSNCISKSFDIVDIIPRRRDKEGNLLNRDAGEKGRKHFFQLNVDMSHLDDNALQDFRGYLTREGNGCKRNFYINFDNYSEIKSDTKEALASQSLNCFSDKKHLMDVSSITRLDKVVSFDAFKKMVVSKDSNSTLDLFIPKEFEVKDGDQRIDSK